MRRILVSRIRNTLSQLSLRGGDSRRSNLEEGWFHRQIATALLRRASQ
ncbi:MAG: hypothetical protein HW388_1335 [Dehalococcoidia bacterium]|nr:hypothetical protein [Dehalococcoidia bacterium]